MKLIPVNTDQTNQLDIDLGLQGENLARTLVFDVSEWRSEYGEGTVQLLHRRAADKEPYPAAIEQEGDLVRWPITAADTAMAGTGRLQLLYFVGETLVKQICRKTFVGKSLGQPTGEVPEAQKPWVEQVLAEVAKVTGMKARAVELPAGSEPTAEYADGVLTIGIPLGGDVSETQIAQAVADYLAAHPIEETDPNVPDWARQPEKPGYTAAEVGALSAETLPDAINTALAQAKESGEFDGADGKDGVDGKDGADGAPGADGGYYTPSVTQPDEKAMRVSFAPSDSGMTAVQAVDVELPVGPPGADGQPGADGKSAYQYAVEGGYTGTEEEFAAKLAEDTSSAICGCDEWETVGSAAIFESVSMVRIDLTKVCRKLLIYGSVTGASIASLRVSANHEDYGYSQNRIAELSVGIHTNGNKRFLIYMERISLGVWLIMFASNVEGTIAANLNVRTVDWFNVDSITYLSFVSGNTDVTLDGGRITVLGVKNV